MKLLVRGGRVIDPKNSVDEIADVLIIDGKIAAIGRDLSVDGDEDVEMCIRDRYRAAQQRRNAECRQSDYRDMRSSGK